MAKEVKLGPAMVQSKPYNVHKKNPDRALVALARSFCLDFCDHTMKKALVLATHIWYH